MTELIGTLGPSCCRREILRQMIAEGMDGVRVNLSHASLEKCAGWIGEYHAAAAAEGIRRPVLIMDTIGPELRTGLLEEDILLEEGKTVVLSAAFGEKKPDLSGQKEKEKAGGAVSGRKETEPSGLSEEEKTERIIPVPEKIFSVIRPGQEILLDDGKLLLKAEDCQTGHIGCRICRGGLLKSRKSIALPGCSIQMPAVTEEDRQNMRAAGRYGVTGIMQPFVRSGEDLIEVRKALNAAGAGDLKIYAKIENRAGMKKIDEILPGADVIVIARGDLGNAMPLWELPAAQKTLAARCRKEKKPFMVATELLASMQQKAVPTRAEVLDIFNAVLDGASSLIVTGETAAGKYPVEVIRFLRKTADEAEKFKGR